METANYLELWKLPPQDETSCGSFIVVDGEVITIEMRARDATQRRLLEFRQLLPHCRPVLACASANHVRNVVRHID